jgi:anti-anti-sigma factor
MELNLTTSDFGSVAILHCSGRIMAGSSADALLHEARELLCRCRRLVLDLSMIESVDAGGLGAFVRLLEWANIGEHEIALLNPSPQLTKLLELVRIRELFEICYSQDYRMPLHLRTACANAECAGSLPKRGTGVPQMEEGDFESAQLLRGRRSGAKLIDPDEPTAKSPVWLMTAHAVFVAGSTP